jgi:DNA-binding MarR family transcriptional regulator
VNAKLKDEPKPLEKKDYEMLAAFRAALRRFVRFTEEGARAAGITPQQHQVMLAIMGQPGRVSASIGEIAEFLQVKHHTAVGLVDRCAAADLVVRRVDPGDRRQIKVSLTAEGEALLARFSVNNLRELESLRNSMGFEVLLRKSDKIQVK